MNVRKEVGNHGHVKLWRATLGLGVWKVTMRSIPGTAGLEETQIEVRAFERATKLWHAGIRSVLGTVDRFSENGQQFFIYGDFTATLEEYVSKTSPLIKDGKFTTAGQTTIRRLLIALHELHWTGNTSHGGLSDASSIVVCVSGAYGTFMDVKFQGLRDTEDSPEVARTKDCEAVATLLETLNLPDKFKYLIEQLRVYGSKNLWNSSFFATPQAVLSSFRYAFRKVMEVAGRVKLDSYFGRGYDWRTSVPAGGILGPAYRCEGLRPGMFVQPYGVGATEFLRFCRNVYEHHKEGDHPPAEILRLLDQVWNDFFHILYGFLADEDIYPFLLDGEHMLSWRCGDNEGDVQGEYVWWDYGVTENQVG